MCSPITWFFRDGKHCGQAVRDVKVDRAKTTIMTKCGRCGGAGGSEKWARTGWSCFDCGGSGDGRLKTVPVYTSQKLEKLNAAQSKARAKRAAKAAEKAAAERDSARAVRRSVFAANEQLARRAWAVRSDRFVRDIIHQANSRRPLTAAQIGALEKAVTNVEGWRAAKAAEKRRKENATHVGEVGERMTARVTAIKKISGGQQYVGFGPWTLSILRTDSGNTLTTFGVCPLREGESAEIKFTVKDHAVNERTGERETRINRLAIVAAKAA